MKIHTSCDTLSIYSFYKIFETRDYKYLLEDKDSIKELTIKQLEQCETAFKDIVNEYSALTANSEVIKNYKAQIRIKAMELRYDITVKTLQAYNDYGAREVLVLLSDVGWKFDITKPVNRQIDDILKKLKGLKNQINIAVLNYKERYNKETTSKFDLEKEALKLSMNLKLTAFLDTKQTSVSRWVHLININRETA